MSKRKIIMGKVLTMFLTSLLMTLVLYATPAFAETTVDLGTAGNFAVLAGEAVKDIPTSDIHGDVGLSPASGSFYDGLTAAEVTGTIYAVDAFGPFGSINNPGLLTTAKNDLITAYDDAAGRTATTIASELGSTTVTPGVYDSTEGTFLITGTLTLDAKDDPNAVFIFQTTSTVITATDSVMNLINGAQSCNVFWKVGSSATIETNSDFKGNILALQSITLKNGANLDGRALARNGAVTMDTNTITASECSVPSAPTLEKIFSPVTIESGGVSTLTITLSNSNPSDATLTAPLIDTLPSGMVIASEPNTGSTCSGTGDVLAIAGGSTVTLPSTRLIPASSTCTVTVDVTATAEGSYDNTLAAGALQTSNGNNAAPASATLAVGQFPPPPVPELSTLVLISSGIFGLLLMLRIKKD